ncbi:hypothetical protein [Aurantimonas sp. HBX-1]|uniref:hypothetical protein n=1 Tax=Aurantimonas sp. HBX-1 TaxID=2906072 RepID=UPI001F302C5A|nr:hypothetical protein [Aurantimonas sp. HBX-1]UIJ73471.1 hypothetical protein LXB15_07515 [Aurantimonas sp. HBX-1]
MSAFREAAPGRIDDRREEGFGNRPGHNLLVCQDQENGLQEEPVDDASIDVIRMRLPPPGRAICGTDPLAERRYRFLHVYVLHYPAQQAVEAFMHGFVRNFEMSLLSALAGAANAGGRRQQVETRTHVIRQTSRGSLDRLIAALHEESARADRLEAENAALRRKLEVARLATSKLLRQRQAAA